MPLPFRRWSCDMKCVSATLLALALVATTGAASAQSSYYGGDPYTRTDHRAYVQPDRHGNSSGVVYDYARVVRVDPVIASGYGSAPASAGRRCYPADGGYVSSDPYRRDDVYGRDGYYGRDDDYGRDPYGRRHGTETGRTVATVVGGIAGAVLGSKVGGGSGTYVASALGSMVGGLAGRQIYDNVQRNNAARSQGAMICDSAPSNDPYAYGTQGYGTQRVNDGRVAGYDVTYEYAGRQFTTRTNYHPGDRIRVRVDVRAE
jgi:uncharacterized protein YcfJ